MQSIDGNCSLGTSLSAFLRSSNPGWLSLSYPALAIWRLISNSWGFVDATLRKRLGRGAWAADVVMKLEGWGLRKLNTSTHRASRGWWGDDIEIWAFLPVISFLLLIMSYLLLLELESHLSDLHRRLRLAARAGIWSIWDPKKNEWIEANIIYSSMNLNCSQTASFSASFIYFEWMGSI